jgi:glycyl-tRNA synthetase
MEHAYDEENVAQKAAEFGLKGMEEPEKGEEGAEGEEENRLVMRFSTSVAPVQVAVLPLLTRKELADPAKEIVTTLREKGLLVNYDDSGTIGRRYRRNDEIGTPYCVTIDYDTLEHGTVTIRDRDSMRQVRAAIQGIEDTLYELIYRGRSFKSAGRPFNF